MKRRFSTLCLMACFAAISISSFANVQPMPPGAKDPRVVKNHTDLSNDLRRAFTPVAEIPLCQRR